jgi:hypothetical protein
LDIICIVLAQIKFPDFVVFKARINPYSIIATEIKNMQAMSQISMAVSFEPEIKNEFI